MGAGQRPEVETFTRKSTRNKNFIGFIRTQIHKYTVSKTPKQQTDNRKTDTRT